MRETGAVPEVQEFLVDLDDLDQEQRNAMGRAILRAVAPSAVRFQVDIPGRRPSVPEDVVRAAGVLRAAGGKASRTDQDYAMSGPLDARDPELWDALVTFMPWSYDGAVWDDEGRRIVNLHDGEVTFVAVPGEQVQAIGDIVGADRLAPWAQVKAERRAARRAWLRAHVVSGVGWLTVVVGLSLLPLPGPGIPLVMAGVVLVVVGGVVTRRRRRQAVAASSVPAGDCDSCGHPWWEHLGSGNDRRGMCGECAYEFEHDQRETDAPGCRLPVPES